MSPARTRPLGADAANLVLGCLALMQLAILYLTAIEPAGAEWLGQ